MGRKYAVISLRFNKKKLQTERRKEGAARTIRCGKCGTVMRGKPEERMGLKVSIQECPRCGKRLIAIDDAVRLQKRALSRMGKRDADMMAGGLKCVCGRTAKRVNDLEYKGIVFGGWRCKCGETLVDPAQANLFLKACKKGSDGAAGAENPHSRGRKGAGLRLRAIQKALGAAAGRKGITKKDLLKTLERVEKVADKRRDATFEFIERQARISFRYDRKSKWADRPSCRKGHAHFHRRPGKVL